MRAGRIITASLWILVGLNCWWGASKVAGFRHKYRGEEALATADLNQAYGSFRAALAWRPDDAQGYFLVGRVIQSAQANGLPLEALEGRQPIEILGIGVAAVAQGIRLSPADAWGWFILGDLYRGYRSGRIRLEAMKRLGDGAAAPAGPGPEDAVSVAAALKAFDLHPKYFFYHDFLAKLYLDRGFTADAVREARESFALWPRPEAHPILEDPGLLEKLAEPILEGIDRSASNHYSGPVVAARARGQILERLGRLDGAIAAFEELRRIGDAGISAECDLELGKLEQERGRDAESLPYLERAVRAAPTTIHGILALYYMGLARSRQGNHQEAALLFRKHLEQAPESLQGYLSLAGELEKIGRSAEAERLYISAVRKFPGNPVTYLNVIEQMRRHGKAKQALSYAEALRKVSPDYEGTEKLILELSKEAAPRLP